MLAGLAVCMKWWLVRAKAPRVSAMCAIFARIRTINQRTSISVAASLPAVAFCDVCVCVSYSRTNII